MTVNVSAGETLSDKLVTGEDSENNRELLTVYIGEQQFGIPILQVEDVLGEQKVANIPLAPPQVAGALNLRGRIVTAINVRKHLQVEGVSSTRHQMSVVVEHDAQFYSLVFDAVGDVLKLNSDDFENTPATLDPIWREVSLGVYRLDKGLLVVLDVPKLLSKIGN